MEFSTAPFEAITGNQGVSEKLLAANEQLVINSDQYLISQTEAFETSGMNAAVLANISAGSKEFWVLDLTNTPRSGDGKSLFENAGVYRADYLLIDNSFNQHSEGGYKGLRVGEPLATVGRNHLQNRFRYPKYTSRDHFQIGVTLGGELIIKNLSPLNGTVVTWDHDNSETSTKTLDPPEIGIEVAEPLPFNLEAGLSELALKGEDRSLVKPEAGLYGVFDGAGGEGNGHLAAETARDSLAQASISHLNRLHDSQDIKLAEEALKSLLQSASQEVARRARGGITTGTVAKIVNLVEHGKDQPHLIWSSAGDSRLYLYHQDTIQQLSTDEGVGNTISNFLGLARGKYTGTVRQAGSLPLSSGDYLILVSDGITGDWDHQLLSDTEIADTIKLDDPQLIAQELVKISKKPDDKTALVVKIK